MAHAFVDTNHVEAIPHEREDDFLVVASEDTLGHNAPQKAGRKLWLPMFIMAAMAFPLALVLAAVRASLVSTGGDVANVAAFGQFVPAAMFLGFAAVFAAISFAIARILGEFRKGGGEVQHAAGATVQTITMPLTAKAFLGIMMMAMMTILAAVVVHVIIGVAILGGSASALAHVEQWSIWLEAVRRIGIAIYLVAIALGLGAIIHVLRFQSVRIREVPDEIEPSTT